MTTAVDRTSRLPGGLGVGRALRLLTGYRLPDALVWALWAAAIVGLYAVLGRAGAVVFIAALAASRLAVRLLRPGVMVTEARQPALYALVRDVATHIGVRPPDRIWLTGSAVVTATVVGRRRDLHLGRSLIRCLTESQVRGLVAHELAILQHRWPWVVTRLRAQWAEAVQATVDRDDWHDAHLAALRDFAATVERSADGASTEVCGGSVPAARALALAAAARLEHDKYVGKNRPRRVWWRDTPAGLAISDLDDGWQRLLSAGLADSLRDRIDADLLAATHPTLADAAARLGDELSAPDDLSGPVPVEPLAAHQERRLARRAQGLAPLQPLPWRRFAKVPATWWIHRSSGDTQLLRRAIRTVLGRRPTDPAEAALVLLTRSAEVRAALGRAIVDGEPGPWLPELIEHALLKRGWRLEHPAVRGIMLGPAEERLDAHELANRALADAPARAELFGLLGARTTAVETGGRIGA